MLSLSRLRMSLLFNLLLCVASMFALLFAFVFGLIVYIEYLLNIGQINSLN